MRWPKLTLLVLLAACATAPPQPAPTYDIVIRNGTIYDGSGVDAIHGDVAIRGDRIAVVGYASGRGKMEIDAHGMAIAPGFINIMSQAQETLIADGRGMSDLEQGVTTEIFGEGDVLGCHQPYCSPSPKISFQRFRASFSAS